MAVPAVCSASSAVIPAMGSVAACAKLTASGSFGSHVVEDGLLITGQNPGSSSAAAVALLAQLKTTS